MPSPNPGGRPKAAQKFAKLFHDQTQNGAELVRIILEIARGKHETCDDAKSIRWALQIAAAYGFGRPQQHVELTTGDGPLRVDYSVLSDVELEQLEAITAKLQLAAASVEAGGDGGGVH